MFFVCLDDDSIVILRYFPQYKGSNGMQLYTLHNAGQVIRQVKSLLCIVCPPTKIFMQDYLSYLRMRSSLARMRSIA
jgi:hypothetical protein